MTGKVALVTGASRGQGAAEARAFAQAGACVVIADVLDAEGSALAAAIEAGGGTARYLHLDVAAEEQWQDAVAKIRAEHGALHVLVNNAGVSLRGFDVVNTERADWDRVLGVNLTGAFLGIKTASPLIRDSGGGAIVNIGSTAGMTGHFAAAYSVSKWGLRGLTKSAAMRLAEWNIRVNAVHPGIVRTEMVTGSMDFVETMEAMTAFERSATPEEVAAVVLFFAGEDARYLTGLDVPIDAGFTQFGPYGQVLRRLKERSAPPG
jgi:NAD(P)-dependent dehydrogenase (short-subunit alcohol dehydrogenase family)